MYAKPGRLEPLDKVRKADAVAETNMRKPGRLEAALQKVKETMAAEAATVTEPTTRKPGRLAPLQKVRETYAAETGSVSATPRGVKAFTRIKAAAAEAEVIAADDVVAKLTRRVNKMSVLTADVVKPQSPAPVEVKLSVLTEPEKEKKEVRVMTPRMRFIVEMSAKPASPRTVLPSIEIRREVTLVRADDDSRTYRISRVQYTYK
jgi:hypothetical protein